jgi:hypothetical protein
VDYCSAACLYVKRAVLDRCGAFERVYEAGYYEDIDLAFKARAAGFKVVYEPRCTVVHHEHASYGPDAAGLLMQSHRDTFRARWAASLASCPAGPFDLADAGARPRLLLVTDLAPANTLSPRMRRIRQVIRALHGTFRIAYLNLVEQGFDRYAALVEELGAVPFYVPAPAAPGVTGLDERELVRVNYFPLALCGGVDAALFLRDRYPASMLEATTVAVDVGMSADVASAATRTGASHFVVMNEPQRQQILTVMPGARCAILPPRGELTTSCPPAREARTDIVMLTDNVDGPAAAAALATMLRSVVPALRSRQPHARLRLAGGALTPGLLAELPDDVDVLSSAMPAGSVLDLARVVVVPQHWCSPDTLSNIAEARARAIPVVTSSTVGAIAGLGDGVDAVTVETPEAFVEQIDRAYADPWWWNGPATPPREDAAPSSDDLTRSLAAWACGDAVVAGKDSTVANRRLPSG